MYAAGILDTRAMVMTIIVFLILKILFILTGRCQQVTPPTGAEEESIYQMRKIP